MQAYYSYIIVIALVIGDVIAVQILNNARRKLDLSKPEDVQKDKKLKLLIPTVLAQSFVVAAVLLYIF